MAVLAELVPAAFQHRTSAGPTDAKAAVWDDKISFERASNEFLAATRKLVDVANADDRVAIANQVKAVGKTCGGCHESFRKPEVESYKRSQPQ
jgi:cytochrome c556